MCQKSTFCPEFLYRNLQWFMCYLMTSVYQATSIDWEHDKWITNCKGMWTRQVVINLDSLISRSLTSVSEENHGKCDWGPSVSPANFTPGRYREGLCESVISLTRSSSIFTSWCLTWRLPFPLLNKYIFIFVRCNS